MCLERPVIIYHILHVFACPSALRTAVRCGDLGAKPPPRSANPRDEGGEPARQDGGKIDEATLTGDFGCVSVGTASWLSACYRWPVAARRVCGPCGFRFTASREGFLGPVLTN
ncbi:hypothetical protein CPLU01_04026 [Colletotrichum plurivorum]|uniref:Uncharacterized protein n=1 Tax=Colletotrichum plurivorum TaxID=2175906 RepID=A0A8H6NK99_9PEZI|nr:hypothetical protein CPLU01_04026 [Colletotrichum plurivorum]